MQLTQKLVKGYNAPKSELFSANQQAAALVNKEQVYKDRRYPSSLVMTSELADYTAKIDLCCFSQQRSLDQLNRF